MPPLDTNNESVNNDAVVSPETQDIFSDEAIGALQDFGKLLQRIHNRLVREGIKIEVDSHYASRNRN